jgi:hypothetical protein
VSRDKSCIGKGLEGTGNDSIEVLYGNLLGETEESREDPLSR